LNGFLNLREQAYLQFQRGLIARDIRPGQFVSQRELTEITGMPLGAIRELVLRLEADGLIRTVPQRGIQIREVDVRLIRDSFGFRLMIEREAAAAFARSAPDTAFVRLADEHEAVLVAAARGVTEALIAQAQALDDNMHCDIVDSLGNEMISSAYRVNMLKIRLVRQSETIIYANLVVPVMRVHLAVIEALASRDARRASAAMEAHIVGSRDRALGFGDGIPASLMAKAAPKKPAGTRSSRRDDKSAARPRTT